MPGLPYGIFWVGPYGGAGEIGFWGGMSVGMRFHGGPWERREIRLWFYGCLFLLK